MNNDKNKIKDLGAIIRKMEDARAEELQSQRLQQGILNKLKDLIENREINKTLDNQIEENLKSKISINLHEKKYKLAK